MIRKISTHILHHLIGLHLSSRLADNESSRHFRSLDFVFNSNDGGVLDVGMSHEERFQLCGSHLESLVFDEFFESIDDVDVAVFPDAHVAGSVEAVEE